MLGALTPLPWPGPASKLGASSTLDLVVGGWGCLGYQSLVLSWGSCACYMPMTGCLGDRASGILSKKLNAQLIDCWIVNGLRGSEVSTSLSPPLLFRLLHQQHPPIEYPLPRSPLPLLFLVRHQSPHRLPFTSPLPLSLPLQTGASPPPNGSRVVSMPHTNTA